MGVFPFNTVFILVMLPCSLPLNTLHKWVSSLSQKRQQNHCWSSHCLLFLTAWSQFIFSGMLFQTVPGATTSSKSNSNWCPSLDLTYSNRCNSRVVEGKPESTLKWAGFDIDLACLKIYHPAPLPGGWWKGKGRTVTTQWGAKLNVAPQHLLKPWATWNLAPWD